MLREEFFGKIAEKLQAGFGGNLYGVPRPVKIVVNMGVGAEREQKESLERARGDLATIAGQMPSFRAAKKAIASFSIRKGDIVGLAVTLRGKRMWDFLEKLVRVVLPRTKNFRGVSRKGLDGHGNFTIGVTEQTAFPEIDPHKIDKIRGLEITIVMSTNDNDEAYQVLKEIGMPFKD